MRSADFESKTSEGPWQLDVDTTPIRKVVIVGTIINALLAAAKLVFGVIGQSRALVADAVNSISDVVTDFTVLLAVHYGNLPADVDHHYGHKKIETVAEIVVGLALVAIAAKMAFDAVTAIWLGEVKRPQAFTVGAAAVTILAKEWLFHWTRKVGKTFDSRVILAKAWDHRSDVFAASAVMAGLVFSQISAQLVIMDAVASVLVSILILRVGWGITREGFMRIIDTAPPASYVGEIRQTILDYPGVRNSHKLKMRYIGNAIHMEVHIHVDPNITVEEGHRIASGIKHTIKGRDRRVIDVIVHVEPEGIAEEK